MKAVFCATKLELETVDHTYLKMSDFGVTETLLEGFQVLSEGESKTLIFSESVLEEQMSESEVISYINLLNKLYPKKIRLIYIKYKRNSDKVVETMYQYDNWDIYFNTKISSLSDSDILHMYDERKMPDTDYVKQVSMEDTMKSGLEMKDALMTALSKSTGIEGNFEFQHLISRNINLIKDMVITLDLMDKKVKEEKKQNSVMETQLMKATQKIVDLNSTVGQHNTTIDKLKNDNSKLFSDVTRVQGAYNSLVDDLSDLLHVGRTNTLNYKTKVVEPSMRKAPTILYFKQVSHINFFTRYISNLVKIMNESMGETKLYVVESESNLLSIPRYTRKGFSYVTNGTSLTEFLLGNLITCGIDTKVIDFLVDNSMNLDYLIIVDKTGVDFDLVTGNSVLKIITANNIADVKELKVEDLLHITNSKDSRMHIPTVKDYQKYVDKESLELSFVGYLETTKVLMKAIGEFTQVKQTDVIIEDLGNMATEEVVLT